MATENFGGQRRAKRRSDPFGIDHRHPQTASSERSRRLRLLVGSPVIQLTERLQGRGATWNGSSATGIELRSAAYQIVGNASHNIDVCNWIEASAGVSGCQAVARRGVHPRDNGTIYDHVSDYEYRTASNMFPPLPQTAAYAAASVIAGSNRPPTRPRARWAIRTSTRSSTSRSAATALASSRPGCGDDAHSASWAANPLTWPEDHLIRLANSSKQDLTPAKDLWEVRRQVRA